MNDQPKQDVNKEIEEVAVEQEVIDTVCDKWCLDAWRVNTVRLGGGPNIKCPA